MATERQVVARRITVGLIRKTADELDAMSADTGLTSTDLVNQAITLAAFVARETAAGKELYLRDPETGEAARLHLL